MHNQRATDNAVLSIQLNLLIHDLHLGLAGAISGNVTEISNVTHAVSRSAMLLIQRIEVRPGGDAAVGIIAELMDMEAVQALV